MSNDDISQNLKEFENSDSLRVPLCAYVEEEAPQPIEKNSENSPFKDPNLGCVKCQIEPYEQCEDIPKQSCKTVPDPDCRLCPPIPKTNVG